MVPRRLELLAVFERAVFAALLSIAAFAPPAPGHAHAGHTDRAPWDACDPLQLGDDCRWQVDNHDIYIGTCRQIAADLMCVRNRPIVSAADGSGPSPVGDSALAADATSSAEAAVTGGGAPPTGLPRAAVGALLFASLVAGLFAFRAWRARKT